MQEMRLSDVLFLFFSLLLTPILVSLSILVFLIPARSSPPRAWRKRGSSQSPLSRCLVSMFMFIPPTKSPHPIYSPFIDAH